MGCAQPVDFNVDELPDLIVSIGANLLMLPNIGTCDKPLFDAATAPTTATWGNAQLGFNGLVDYNRDGWPDLFTAPSMTELNAGRGGFIPGPRILQRLHWQPSSSTRRHLLRHPFRN